MFLWIAELKYLGKNLGHISILKIGFHYLFIHWFISQIVTKGVLCIWHCARYLEYTDQQTWPFLSEILPSLNNISNYIYIYIYIHHKNWHRTFL